MARRRGILLFFVVPLFVLSSAVSLAYSRPTQSDMASESHTFLITDHGIPVSDQLDSWSCLIFASTNIVEYLIHDATGKHSFLDEWWFIPYGRGTDSSFNEFTDEPFAIHAALKNYGSYAPAMNRTVLFSRGYDSSGTWNPWGAGGMSQAELNQMKSVLATNNSPVLFIYKDPSVVYWHANVCMGYDDNAQELICRDSLLGKPFTYDGRRYRDVNRIPYRLALASGKHASVWYVTERTPRYFIPEVPLTRDFRASSYLPMPFSLPPSP